MIWWVGSVVGGFRWLWANRWWWVAMGRFSGGWVSLSVGCNGMSGSMVMGSNVWIRWWVGWPMDRLVATVGGCRGCAYLGCVFCFCFCFFVVMVLVFCCDGSGVRRWWDGMCGVDGWVGQQWVGVQDVVGLCFCCFCFSMMVVLVFYCGGSSVRQWWGGLWGVDGC